MKTTTMKSPIFKIILLFTLLISFQGVWSQQTLQVWIPIKEVLNEHAHGYLVSAEIPFCLDLKKKTPAQVVGVWEESVESREVYQAGASVSKVEEGQAIFKVNVAPDQPVNAGDLLQVTGTSYCDLAQGTVLQLAANAIFLTNIYELPFYSLGDALVAEDLSIDDDFLEKAVEDIRFTGNEMETQGQENPVLEGGNLHDQQPLFTAMQQTDESEVLAFVTYVLQHPLKYRGHFWKISEVFATWLVNGAPGATAGVSEISGLFEFGEKEPLEVNASDCEGNTLMLDTKKGTLNGVAPTANFSEIKHTLSCFTGETDEGADYNCGGGVFYLHHYFFFYSFRDCIEIRDGFAGQSDIDLLSLQKWQVEQVLGKPDRIPVEPGSLTGYASQAHWLYKRKYGTLRISFHPETDEVSEIGLHAQTPGEVDICW